jgi:hypothetical protein
MTKNLNHIIFLEKKHNPPPPPPPPLPFKLNGRSLMDYITDSVDSHLLRS